MGTGKGIADRQEYEGREREFILGIKWYRSTSSLNQARRPDPSMLPSTLLSGVASDQV
jgi:hypothetical protein